VLERFGTPFYCKIDIEGNDNLCLKDIIGRTKPKFLSIEIIRGDPQLQLLEDVGYTKFKLISQRTLRQPAEALAALKARMPTWARTQFIRIETHLSRKRADREWRFPNGSSGPFADETPGNWLTIEEALALNAMLDEAYDFSEWFDIHATFDEGDALPRTAKPSEGAFGQAGKSPARKSDRPGRRSSRRRQR
jgi:hypothetical protein